METPPALDRNLVEEFVRVAHGDFDRVKELLQQEPALVNACWDWGGGDWETALGAAAHTNSKAIAEHLLSRGARMDVFCAAMLGKVEIVKAFLADDPQVAHQKGPHGIPLMDHARIGGQDAVVELLEAHGTG